MLMITDVTNVIYDFMTVELKYNELVIWFVKVNKHNTGNITQFFDWWRVLETIENFSKEK